MNGLPTIDEYQELRAKIRDVFGDDVSKTLLSILPFQRMAATPQTLT